MVAAAEHQNGQTKLYAFRNAKPVQIAQEWWNAVVFTTVRPTHQSSCRVEHWLQTIHQMLCDAVECDAAVVKTSQNHCCDERHQNGLGDGATNAACPMKSAPPTTRATSWHYFWLHARLCYRVWLTEYKLNEDSHCALAPLTKEEYLQRLSEYEFTRRYASTRIQTCRSRRLWRLFVLGNRRTYPKAWTEYPTFLKSVDWMPNIFKKRGLNTQHF